MIKKQLPFLTAVILILLLLVVSGEASAETINVSSKSELANALSAARPGQVIVLKNGTYNDLGEIKLTRSGTADSKIVLKPETPGGVRFTGKLTFYLQGSYIELKDFYFDRIHFDKNSGYNSTNLIKFSGAKYCELSGNYFYNCGNATDMGETGTGIYGMYTPIVELKGGSRFNKISNNVFRDNFSISVALVADNNYDNSYNTIEQNCFKDIRSVNRYWGNVSSGNGMECIQIGQNTNTGGQSTYTTIKNNLFENVTGDGAEVVSIKTSDNIIEHNTFRNCNAGLVLRIGSNNTADGNFMFGTQGIRVYEDGHIIRNNYIADSTMGIFLDGSDGNNHFASTDVKVYNNTVINPAQFGIRIGSSKNTEFPSYITVRNNYVLLERQLDEQYKAYKNFGCTGPYISGNLCTVYDGNQGLFMGVSRTDSANMVLSDGLYRPAVDSSLINSGEEIENLYYDMDGQKRDSLPDCGADEYSEEEIKYKPLDMYSAGSEAKWWIYVMRNGYDENGVDTGTEFSVTDDKITASRMIEPFKEAQPPVEKTLILAEYDGNKLVDIAIQTRNICKPGIYGYSLSLNYDGEHIYKAFLWDNARPVETVTEYKK